MMRRLHFAGWFPLAQRLGGGRTRAGRMLLPTQLVTCSPVSQNPRNHLVMARLSPKPSLETSISNFSIIVTFTSFLCSIPQGQTYLPSFGPNLPFYHFPFIFLQSVCSNATSIFLTHFCHILRSRFLQNAH